MYCTAGRHTFASCSHWSIQYHSTSRLFGIKEAMLCSGHSSPISMSMYTAQVSMQYSATQRTRTDRCRRCGIGTNDLPLRAFLASIETQILRAFRRGSRSGLHHLIGHAILALSQLSNILELPVCDYGYLAHFIPRPTVLSQLDESVADVILHWRGGRRHSSPRKCDQNHNPDSSEVETWTIRLPSHARNLRL